eukprot:14398418-Alexandrium_andersonii.AAC.1
MSASLVGSEMCIRDRYSGSVRLRAASAGMAVKSTAELGMARSALRPVSYTHLTLPTICSV